MTGGQTKKTFRWAIISLFLIVCGTALAATYFRQQSIVAGENNTEVQRVDPSPWPADLPVDRDQMMSFQSLFKQWKIPYKNKEDICQQAQAEGYAV